MKAYNNWENFEIDMFIMLAAYYLIVAAIYYRKQIINYLRKIYRSVFNTKKAK